MSGVVVAISGPPGAGKSTLAQALCARLGARHIEYDRFETMTRRPPGETQEWIRRGAPYREIACPGLAEELEAARLNGPVVFDTPLGRAHPQTGGCIDFAVWIHCPADLALARKLGQLSAQVPPEHAGDFLGWLRGYLVGYEQIVRPSILIQVDRVAPAADLIVDATVDVAELVETIAAALEARPSTE